MSEESLRAEIEALRRENDALRKRAGSGLSMRVGAKGGLSLYGLGRFPVTLYKRQWLRLLDAGEEIRDYITLHDSELAEKE